MDIRSKMPMSRTERLVVQQVDDEMLVYDLKLDKAICLNPTAKFLWGQCDGETTIVETLELLNKTFEIDSGEDFVLLAIRELSDANLLADESGFFAGDVGVTRRDLVTRYGVPMATLPIVMALVAPAAVHAQSCAGTGQPCTVDADCCLIPPLPVFCIGVPGMCMPE